MAPLKKTIENPFKKEKLVHPTASTHGALVMIHLYVQLGK
jgi:hypothetical protein